MKIVQVVQHLAPGGIETMVLELQRIYQKTDEVIIISLEGHIDESLQRWPRLMGLNCQMVFCDKAPGLRPGLVYELVQLFRKIKPDVVHTHHIGPLIYAGTAARITGTRHIVHTEHDGWHLESSKKRQTLQRLALRYVRPKLVADASHVADILQRFFPDQSLNVILNGIDTRRFRPGKHINARKRLELPEGKIIIGCAARLVKGKGHTYLLDALARLPGNIHLALAGDGPLRCDLMAQARQIGIVHRVHFLGTVESMPTFYQALDLFCLPSEAEGLPLSPLEAQACGVPVLITDTGGCREAVCSNTGLLVPPKDSQALAQGVHTLLKGFTRSTQRSPRDYVLQKHDLCKVARDYRMLMR